MTLADAHTFITAVADEAIGDRAYQLTQNETWLDACASELLQAVNGADPSGTDKPAASDAAETWAAAFMERLRTEHRDALASKNQ